MKTKTISNIEQEVNQIRLKIYEETEVLTAEQYTERVRKIGEAAAKKYGFQRISSASEKLTVNVEKSIFPQDEISI